MEYRTIEGVELGSVGMNWPGVTGDVTFTFEDLADVARAANEDPHVAKPRVKIGHYSPINGDAPLFNPFAEIGDAEPSFGRVVNLSLANDGGTLIGDLVEVPAWLVDAVPSAYTNRSGEWLKDVETPGGKRYSCVMTALALLGVALPAVQDLEDLTRLLTVGPPELVATSQRPRTTTRRQHALTARPRAGRRHKR